MERAWSSHTCFTGKRHKKYQCLWKNFSTIYQLFVNGGTEDQSTSCQMSISLISVHAFSFSLLPSSPPAPSLKCCKLFWVSQKIHVKRERVMKMSYTVWRGQKCVLLYFCCPFLTCSLYHLHRGYFVWWISRSTWPVCSFSKITSIHLTKNDELA